MMSLKNPDTVLRALSANFLRARSQSSFLNFYGVINDTA